MASEFFKTLVFRQIDMFVKTFADDSNSLFKNERKKLIHPGEYGMYRERCFKSLLQCVLTKDYGVSDGFIVTAKDNHVSTQCDILIYRNTIMPLTDGGIGNFYPVEEICGIGEIKSNLNKEQFKKALRKLALNKQLEDDRCCLEQNKFKHFLHLDGIPTFLVCNKLEFDIKQIDFGQIYDGIERKYWHNFILSIEDGLLIYEVLFDELQEVSKQAFKDLNIPSNEKGVAFQYPFFSINLGNTAETYDCKTNYVEINKDEKYNHIILFLAGLKQALQASFRYEFDSIVYLGVGMEWCEELQE